MEGFCDAAPIERVREFNFVPTPLRNVGLSGEEGDFYFKERFTQLKVEFEVQLWEEAKPNALIAEVFWGYEFKPKSGLIVTVCDRFASLKYSPSVVTCRETSDHSILEGFSTVQVFTILPTEVFGSHVVEA